MTTTETRRPTPRASAVTDSRLIRGTITLGTAGANEFSTQLTAFVIEQQDGNSDDPVTTLSGDTVGGGSDEGPWHLTGTAIQDFDNPTGFQQWSYANRGTDQEFEFNPNDKGTGPTVTGVVAVKFLGMGGDVNTRITRDFDWAVPEEPEFNWGTTPPLVATGAAAGTPGTFTPDGAETPAAGAGVEALTANP